MESENWDSPYEYLIISFRKSPLLIDERAPFRTELLSTHWRGSGPSSAGGGIQESPWQTNQKHPESMMIIPGKLM